MISLREYRCTKCQKLLFKGVLVDSTVEIKCKGCGSMATFQGEASASLLCLKEQCPNRVSR